MLAHLRAIVEKPERRIVGLMSGTSMDGIDAALVRVRGSGLGCRVTLERFECRPYDAALRLRLLHAASGEPIAVGEFARLHAHVAAVFAEAALAVIGAAGLVPRDVDAIGTHGQTLFHHAPAPGPFDPERTTWQAGSLPVLAARTGILTVGDFRPADIAFGGTGAPLVPYCDFVLRRSATENRVLLNLGGIANLTYLPAGATAAAVCAWDVGPGNLVMDGLAQELLGEECDRDGAHAARGRVDHEWVASLLGDEYFRRAAPKSAGREQFGAGFVRRVLERAAGSGMSPEDLLATAVELTAGAVADALRRPPLGVGRVDTVYVTGGGRHNRTLMQRLTELVLPAALGGIEVLGVDPDAKEAVDFAVLANETLCGNSGNLPNVTGAQRACILGAIAWAGDGSRRLEST